MSFVFVIILIVLIIYIYRSDRKNWSEIYREDEEALNKVQRRIRYLKKNGIRCRMIAPGFKGMSFQDPPEDVGKFKIMVRKKDEERAKKLLEEYSPGEYSNEE